MALIKARKQDWHPDDPGIRPLVWIVPVLLLGLIVFGLTSWTGSFVNRDQHALLSHSGPARLMSEPVEAR
jgi:hypothetical protein